MHQVTMNIPDEAYMTAERRAIEGGFVSTEVFLSDLLINTISPVPNTPVSPKLPSSYEVIDDAEVLQFLKRHPSVAVILSDAVDPIETIFGTGTVTVLSVIGDPEAEPTMSAHIKVNVSIDQAKALRQTFYSSWWMPTATKLHPPLTFNVEVI